MKPVSNSVFLCRELLQKRISPFAVPSADLIHNDFSEHKRKLFELIQRLAECGESNSMLLVGPKGCGKTKLLSLVLKDLEEQVNGFQDVLQVHLDGLLQSDQRIAIEEITRQLHLENSVKDKVFGSFAENFHFLLDSLKTGNKESSKAVLFILDKFDLFAHHKNQTLLYNLFDVSQSQQTPICVLGLTTSLDVVELLEKRVKSRFSHRQLYMLPKFTFTDYEDRFFKLVTLPTDFKDAAYLKEWNLHVKNLRNLDSLKACLKHQFDTDHDNFHLLNKFLLHPVCKLSLDNPFLNLKHILESSRQVNINPKVFIINGLSILELCLLIAMKHLDDLYNGEAFNFEMVYNEYLKFINRRATFQSYDKAVVFKAYEHLLSLQLLMPVGRETIGRSIQKEYRQMHLHVTADEISQALQVYQSCPTDLKQWAIVSSTALLS